MTLTEFLLARIAEDEAAALRLCPGRNAANGHWRRGSLQDEAVRAIDPLDADHVLRHDPARVLAECEAKRRIVAEAFEVAATIDGEWGCCHDADDIRRGYREPTPGWGDEAEPLPEGCAGPEVAGKFLQALAAVYAGHEDYRQEWKP